MSKKQIFEVVLFALSVMLVVAKAVDEISMLPEFSDKTEPDMKTENFL